jgi:multidrug efflux pump subunit AcrA (membrane-fusion protein)
MVAKVKVIHKVDVEEGLMVPVESVFSKEGKNGVWLVDKKTNKVVKKEVEVKKICGEGYLHVISDIKPGDIVVTAGVYSIIENQEVKLLPKKSKTNTGGLL